MNRSFGIMMTTAALMSVAAPIDRALANAYREKGVITQVGKSGLVVTPPRDWNRLSVKPGKFAETWTLDGEQLNDITFYTGVIPGSPLVREVNKKRDPLPKFTREMLLAELPELLGGTYRAYKKISTFTLTGSQRDLFLGHEGIKFSYQYIDVDGLPRRGEAKAVIIDAKLHMITFDAPRLHYFDKTLPDFRALSDTAVIKG